MKTITLYQPYASLVAVRAKKFETRGWGTSYHGPLAIHAGKKKPSDVLGGVDADIIIAMGRALGLIADGASVHVREVTEMLDRLPRGAIVSITELAGCFKMWDGRQAGLGEGTICIKRPNQYWSPNWMGITDEYLFGDWRPGRFAWELKEVEALPEPIPVRGMQGLWQWDEVGLR